MEDAARQLELARRAAQGDSAALKLLLVESHRRLGRHVAARIPRNLTRLIDPDDVLQEAYVEVFVAIERFVPQQCTDSFYRWVATIAMNRLRDAARKHRALKRGGDVRVRGRGRASIRDSTIALLDLVAGPEKTPSRTMAKGEAVDAVHEALNGLPEHYQQAVWLVYVEGQPAKDAAEQMGRTERAVHGLCRRGLKLLCEQLKRASVLPVSTG